MELWNFQNKITLARFLEWNFWNSRNIFYNNFFGKNFKIKFSEYMVVQSFHPTVGCKLKNGGAESKSHVSFYTNKPLSLYKFTNRMKFIHCPSCLQTTFSLENRTGWRPIHILQTGWGTPAAHPVCKIQVLH